MKALIVSIVLGCWGITASACLDQGSGFIRGERLEVADCGGSEVWAPFDAELSFFSALRGNDVVLIRVSDTSQLIEVADSLAITIPSYQAVQEQIAADGSATFPIGPDGVSVSLTLLASCPESMTALTGGAGSITLTQLGTLTGERIAAELEFDLIDARTSEVVGITFEASLDFKVQAGTPHESFSDTRRQHGE